METRHALTHQNTPSRAGPLARIQHPISGRNRLERGSVMGRTEWSVSSALPQVISKRENYIPGFHWLSGFRKLENFELKQREVARVMLPS